MKHSILGVPLLALGFWLAAGPTSVSAQDSVVLVLDSSGSMAGQIDNKVKLDIARSAINELLGKLKPTTSLGLIAYGHRRKGDCGDIETIHEVGTPDAQAIKQAVGRLRAVGKTPLSAAVRQAADQLNFTVEKSTIILISDGKENCGFDPCELGRELNQKGIDFKVHVVGFDVPSNERAGLRCLAEATGGRFVLASNAQSLGDAISEVVEVAETIEAKPIPPPEPIGEIGLRVDVVVSDGGAPWEGEIGIKVFRDTVALDDTREEIAGAWRTKSGHIIKDLTEGSHRLEVVLADHPHIVREFSVDVVPDDAQIVVVNMDVGQVRFDASLMEGGPPFTGELGWTILARDKDLDGTRQQIANFWRVKSGDVFWLPAGSWQLDGVIADANYLTATKELAVEAGGSAGHVFSFDAGTVRFDASLSAGGPEIEDELGWKVMSTTKDLSGNRSEVTNFWRVPSGDVFLLPEGTWLIAGVLADHPHVMMQNTIKVAPGSEVAHQFDFASGRVRFDLTVNGQPISDEVGLTVLKAENDADGNQEKIADFWRVKSGYTTVLPAGRYELTALLADQKDVTGRFAIEIAPGDEKILTLDMTRP
ncbi:vWA domain-containing protein [Bauldia litoralis]|uniref:von Willebrand factor type A domain-containing protein n=1 Tax=Bauldia litoralis TaxID=665467 RepID=A0A1G6EN04_9HYPH|nr:VWA domain-containing protein [Bauldia litoralis]SDB58676.1 von Willebrand factor type A domain-containing protein [Bauldia litoralis]